MTGKKCFSYIRVSTIRQGLKGTSLTEQQSAISHYAERLGLNIIQQFEEKETAAKSGRPIFDQMLKLLKQGKANGVIIHKIDRSARNLKDWSILEELADQGIEVHFANEGLVLHSRGSRLSADIQAVVAADYIRNLREETIKGFYGRLKQGLLPLAAPVGYLDMGGGKAKEPNPKQAPLVKKAFELYATGKWPIRNLVEKMYDLGLRGKMGSKITKNGIFNLLHNPFYMGLIRIKIKGELYPGVHNPLISQQLFERVQGILSGKKVEKKIDHFFIFRKLICCSKCGNKLIGETHTKKISQIKYTYYRCHTPNCPEKTIREDVVEAIFCKFLQELRFTEDENQYLRLEIKKLYHEAFDLKDSQVNALNLELAQVRNRLSKLTDLCLDGLLDKEAYLEKKNTLLLEENALKEKLRQLDGDIGVVFKKVEQFLELLNNAYLSYLSADLEKKRELVEIVTSKLVVEGKELLIKPNYPFEVALNRSVVLTGRPQRDIPRTLNEILKQLLGYFISNTSSQNFIEHLNAYTSKKLAA